ncbi:antibiotic biosynthesis monooxygenase family protein [Desertihabitans aurantiacus]|uniref:antibiotic biosynthesis monooxygenase family protein n=1 Tax=Desertihabitans aurantiacus TaxID=2282477 RepID=UPI000DF794C3|nr:antibiotic biosynthesis monooxygenase family protein [Desertihabitans aurantiacus]
MIVLTRFRVPAEGAAEFVAQAEAAVAVLSARPGFLGVDLGRNLDDPDLWTITTRWADVGSYRRALHGLEAKMVVVPLLSRAVDEPTAYDDPDRVGVNRPRGQADG